VRVRVRARVMVRVRMRVGVKMRVRARVRVRMRVRVRVRVRVGRCSSRPSRGLRKRSTGTARSLPTQKTSKPTMKISSTRGCETTPSATREGALLERERRASPFIKVKPNSSSKVRQRARSSARSCAASASCLAMPPPAAAAFSFSSFTSCSRASEERRRASASLLLALLTARAASRTAREVSSTWRNASFWSFRRLLRRGRFASVCRCAAVELLYATTLALPAVGSTGGAGLASVERVATT
jgi:hypothetical protein